MLKAEGVAVEPKKNYSLRVPTFNCPRCFSTDGYFAPRQVGVNVENWRGTQRLPNSTQWQSVNQALCRQCGEFMKVSYSKDEQIAEVKQEIKTFINTGLIYGLVIGGLVLIGFIVLSFA